MENAGGTGSPSEWRSDLVVAVIAAMGSIDAPRIARYAGLELDAVRTCLESLYECGAITGDDRLSVDVGSTVSPKVLGDIHGAIAEDLLSAGLDHVHDAVLHARQAIDIGTDEHLVARLDGAAAFALASARLADAKQLLEVAEEADHTGDPLRRIHRLQLLAEALDGQGLVAAAKETRARAFEIADLSGHRDHLWRVATAHALPCDWFEGDHRSSSLLVRAASVTYEPLPSAAVTAARAMVAMRVPSLPANGPQVAWVTRASLAQPLAEEALTATTGSTGFERLLSLLAWRATHRAPTHLDRRRRVTAEALDMAQVLHRSDLMVEAGLYRAVDGIESADPGIAEQAVALARWASEASRNPRLQWQVAMTDVGLAFMRLDHSRAESLRDEGRRMADECGHPGAFSAEVLFGFQSAMLDADPDRLGQIIVPDDSPLLAHPLARAGQAYAQAVCGRPEQARRNLSRCLAVLDDESSMLLVLHLLARCAYELGDRIHIEQVITHLRPFAAHVTVDAHGWWNAGPVACDLAELELACGDLDAAMQYWSTASRIATMLDDRRSGQRLDILRSRLDEFRPGMVDRHVAALVSHRLAVESLSTRERDVLDLVVKGLTNREIAAELAFSLSTIRATTMSIYRQLGLSGRAAVISALLGVPQSDAAATTPPSDD